MMHVDKILLVDDDSITNDLNTYLINKLKAGEEIRVLKNGKEALDYLKTSEDVNADSPPLMFLDINMPVMNGEEFLQAFENRLDELPNRPVILVLSTTKVQKEIDRIEAHPSVLGMIEKPLTPEKLQRAILAYTEHSTNLLEGSESAV